MVIEKAHLWAKKQLGKGQGVRVGVGPGESSIWIQVQILDLPRFVYVMLGK